jgi:hydrogenase expression/formation protein HypE
MHDVTEGGVLTALFEMSEASGVGVEVWADRIPVLPETRAICDFFGADPFSLVSSGAMLIATSSGSALVGELAAEGVPASVIGRVTAKGKTLHRDGLALEIVPAERDELWRILEAQA